MQHQRQKIIFTIRFDFCCFIIQYMCIKNCKGQPYITQQVKISINVQFTAVMLMFFFFMKTISLFLPIFDQIDMLLLHFFPFLRSSLCYSNKWLYIFRVQCRVDISYSSNYVSIPNNILTLLKKKHNDIIRLNYFRNKNWTSEV